MKSKKLGLILYVVIAIIAGICCGYIMPDWFVRIAITFNKLFSNFLSFFIPLLILGFVASGIADIGREGGRMLLITFVLAYAFSIFGGIGSFATSSWILPEIVSSTSADATFIPDTTLTPYFVLDMPPFINVIGALIIALILGIGCNYTDATRIKKLLNEFRDIIQKVITKVSNHI